MKANSPAELRSRLEARYPGRAFAFPHHICYRTGARGINWSVFDKTLSPVLEMVSMHGCSETSLGDRPFLHSMGPSDGRSTVRYGLSRGFVFGLIGNTDHHSGYPGSYGHGRSCVYAADNPNNVTPATQAISARVRVRDTSIVRATLDGQMIEVPASRLFEGALSGNLGPIDSPAYGFIRCPFQGSGSGAAT